MKQIVLCGANGQVGSYLQKVLSSDYDVVAVTRREIDLTKVDTIQTSLKQLNPDLIINAAAYTAVDAAETDQENAFLVNNKAVEQLAIYSSKNNVPLIHYSTDYVFSGDAEQPYIEDSEPSPNGVYGESKLAGEQAVVDADAPAVILRTSWVYSNVGKNFYKTMKRLAGDHDELSVVSDQIGSPTYAGSIADATKKMVGIIFQQGELLDSQRGIYHFSCNGYTSWHGFASELLKMNGFDKIKINAIQTSEFPTPAKRPAYSVLDNSKLAETFSIRLPDWRQALQDCVAEAD